MNKSPVDKIVDNIISSHRKLRSPAPLFTPWCDQTLMRSATPDAGKSLSLSVHAPLNPGIFAASGEPVGARVAAADFSRLLPRLDRGGDSGQIAVRVHFVKGGRGGDWTAEIEIEGSLPLLCQRCLASISLPLQEKYRLSLIASAAEFDRMGAGKDAIMLDRHGQTTLADLVEDQLILLLPFAPKCEHAGAGECSPAPVEPGSKKGKTKPA